VPFQAFIPINPIRSISIGDLALQFDQQSPFDPQTESSSVQASLRKSYRGYQLHVVTPLLELPFGFPILIGEIQNDLMIVNRGNPVANISTVHISFFFSNLQDNANTVLALAARSVCIVYISSEFDRYIGHYQHFLPEML
jgi:hypothetical protein